MPILVQQHLLLRRGRWGRRVCFHISNTRAGSVHLGARGGDAQSIGSPEPPADGWASFFMTRKTRPHPPHPLPAPTRAWSLPQSALDTAAQTHSGFACQLPGLTSQIYLLTQPFERLMCSRKIESCPSKPPSDWAMTSDSCKQLRWDFPGSWRSWVRVPEVTV